MFKRFLCQGELQLPSLWSHYFNVKGFCHKKPRWLYCDEGLNIIAIVIIYLSMPNVGQKLTFRTLKSFSSIKEEAKNSMNSIYMPLSLFIDA